MNLVQMIPQAVHGIVQRGSQGALHLIGSQDTTIVQIALQTIINMTTFHRKSSALFIIGERFHRSFDDIASPDVYVWLIFHVHAHIPRCGDMLCFPIFLHG